MHDLQLCPSCLVLRTIAVNRLPTAVLYTGLLFTPKFEPALHSVFCDYSLGMGFKGHNISVFVVSVLSHFSTPLFKMESGPYV